MESKRNLTVIYTVICHTVTTTVTYYTLQNINLNRLQLLFHYILKKNNFSNFALGQKLVDLFRLTTYSFSLQRQCREIFTF